MAAFVEKRPPKFKNRVNARATLRTQITRTSEDLATSAPGRPVAGGKSRPSRNSGSRRPERPRLRAACGAGGAASRRFSVTMPANRPWDRARRRRQSRARRRLERDRALDGRASARLCRDRTAAALALRIGNADMVSLAAGSPSRQRRGVRLPRRIDAQQRESPVVLGDTVGMAEPAGDDHLAAVVDLRVGEDVARAAHDDAGAVFDVALGLSARGVPVGNGTNALAMAIAAGSMMPSVAWSYRMVRPRTSPSTAWART